MNAIAETRVRRLADALSEVSKPLQPLYEYAEDLEKHFSDGSDVEVTCIAALLRARAAEARQEIARTLEAVEEAASKVAAAV